MPYTLSMGLLWFALALVLGMIIGVALRSVSVRRQVGVAREAAVDRDELEHLRARVAELEAAAADAAESGRETPSSSSAPAVSAAEEPRGSRVEPDDLTMIEGLGPGVCELCHGIGILTFADLADTEVSLLRTLLADAGARYQVHDPTTWPAQAQLLAEGRWDEFRELAASVRDEPSTDPPTPPTAPSPAES
jgi:predicted flap endonuclease-1-like 5' DNA nuclease